MFAANVRAMAKVAGAPQDHRGLTAKPHGSTHLAPPRFTRNHRTFNAIRIDLSRSLAP
jgi:hypothetical protein